MDMKELLCARSLEKKYCHAGTEAEKNQGFCWVSVHCVGMSMQKCNVCLKSWDELGLLGTLRCSHKTIPTPSDCLAQVS